MIVLGIETSCDETGVAVVDDGRRVLAHLVLSQLKDHEIFGGVVPEIAARAHLTHLDRLIAAAMKQAGAAYADLDGVAATTGPGLIGGVMVGMMAAKSIALVHKKPFMGVNHLEAHVLSPRLMEDIPFPYLVLLVSGGHTQILVAEAVGRYRLWASTRDDAVGECFDKAAKLMGLPYPGGPNLEKTATTCNAKDAALARFPFAIPLEHSPDIDFSFSGLKTSVRNTVDKATQDGTIRQDDLAALSYSFQHTVAATLQRQSEKAMAKFRTTYHQVSPVFAVCGGVAANQTIRSGLQHACIEHGFIFMAPPLEYCTDNGAMVAWAGLEMLRDGQKSPLDIPARPRWPLETLNQKEA